MILACLWISRSSSRPDLRFRLSALRLPWFAFITSSLIRGDYGRPEIVIPCLMHAWLVGGGRGVDGGKGEGAMLFRLKSSSTSSGGLETSREFATSLRNSDLSVSLIFIHVTSFVVARDPERLVFTAKRK